MSARIDHKRVALLLGRGEEHLATAIEGMAPTHGLAVARLAGGEEALADLAFDLLIASVDLPGQWTGLELLGAMRELGSPVAVILIGDRPDFEACRRALRLEAHDFLAKPVTTEQLSEAITRALEPSDDARTSATGEHQRTYLAGTDTVEQAARELIAFLIERGVGPSHRLRVTSAAAEFLDNAARHAYIDSPGNIRVSATIAGSHVTVAIEDDGSGFDTARVGRDGPRASEARAAESGIVRARRLSESLELESSTAGTRARMAFELNPVTFDEARTSFADLDYLVPDDARRLLHELMHKGVDDPVEVPPALLPTVGRLLTAFDVDAKPLTAWRS